MEIHIQGLQCRYSATSSIRTSVLLLLERNGNIVYNITIRQRACSHEITASFLLDCPLLLNIPVMKFTIYSNGTMTALRNDSDVITCVSEAWPVNNATGKMESHYIEYAIHCEN